MTRAVFFVFFKKSPLKDNIKGLLHCHGNSVFSGYFYVFDDELLDIFGHCSIDNESFFFQNIFYIRGYFEVFVMAFSHKRVQKRRCGIKHFTNRVEKSFFFGLYVDSSFFQFYIGNIINKAGKGNDVNDLSHRFSLHDPYFMMFVMVLFETDTLLRYNIYGAAAEIFYLPITKKI
jgi:hypothetical protein